jgi:hypothetical protein
MSKRVAMLSRIVNRGLEQALSSADMDSGLIRIRERWLIESAGVRSTDVWSFCEEDLTLLFRLYDEIFFAFAISAELRRRNATIRACMSHRLTSAGARTWHRPRSRRRPRPSFEIAISSTLLASSFQTPGEQHEVVGLRCGTRLDALHRVFEHELVHLVEFLVFGRSSCRNGRFQALAAHWFGHRSATHQLIRPLDHARETLGIRPGDPVSFEYRGLRLRGFVARITKRATVLVPDSNGAMYTDGRRYEKYLIPLSNLTRELSEAGG